MNQDTRPKNKEYDSWYDDPWQECTADEARKMHSDGKLVRHRGWEDPQVLIHGYAIDDEYTLSSLRQLANDNENKKTWMWVSANDTKLV